VQKSYAGERVMQIGRLLGGASASDRKINHASASLLLQELLLWLKQRSQVADTAVVPSRVSQAIDGALQIIESDFADTELTIPRLARRVGISQNYLAIHFQQRTGMTLSRYLLSKRIEHARQLLLMTNLPISRIGTRVGLADPQYFNKVFRAQSGLSPSVYRTRHQADKV
jgi:AraC-like DNA-binding protein